MYKVYRRIRKDGLNISVFVKQPDGTYAPLREELLTPLAFKLSQEGIYVSMPKNKDELGEFLGYLTEEGMQYEQV